MTCQIRFPAAWLRARRAPESRRTTDAGAHAGSGRGRAPPAGRSASAANRISPSVADRPMRSIRSRPHSISMRLRMDCSCMPRSVPMNAWSSSMTTASSEENRKRISLPRRTRSASRDQHDPARILTRPRLGIGRHVAVPFVKRYIAGCQSARNVDPLSASNIHPPVGDQRLACPALAGVAEGRPSAGDGHLRL